MERENRSTRREDPRVATDGEAGFSMPEVAVTLGILAVLVMSMSVTLASGMRYLLSAKQRAATVQVANAIIERARAVAINDWTQLGLVPGDIDPGADPNIVAGTCGSETANMFSGEPIVAAGTTDSNPLYPHVRDTIVGNTTITLRIYVTGVTPGSCSMTNPAYKRITVLGTWLRGQGGTSTEVRLASYIYNTGSAPVPVGGGPGGGVCAPSCSVTAASGTFQATASYTSGKLTGAQVSLLGGDPPATTLFLPHSVADGRNVGKPIVYKGSAVSAVGAPAGETGTPEHKATSLADNDDTTAKGPGTWPVPDCESGAWSDTVGALSTGNLIQTAGSCSSIFYDDGVPYASSTTDLSSGISMSSTVPAGGVLPAFGVTEFTAAGAATSTSTVDATAGANGQETVTSTSTTGLPSIDILRFSAGGFDASQGAVRIEAGTYTATAAAGMNASSPSFSGAVTFKVYDPEAVLTGCDAHASSYCVITIDPAASGFGGFSRTFSVTLSVGLPVLETARITLTSRITIPRPKVEEDRSGTEVLSSKVTFALPKVATTMAVESPVGTTLSTVTGDADLGQLLAIGSYSP